jgi:zona occludens toxin
MAGISAYTGLQGHGKSYEVVANVIVPGVATGRRIVTNVAGLQVEAIKTHCISALGKDAAELGDVVVVSNEDLEQSGFFPKERKDSEAPAPSIVQGGDIVVLDEAWRWYGAGEKMPAEHMVFFRMHRHFASPTTGCTCDVVLIVQDISDLQRKVRSVVEKTFVMQKHKDLGLNDRYVVSIYAGSRIAKTKLLESLQCKYKPEIFSLYTSYSQSNGIRAKEVNADRRGNIFLSRRFLFVVPAALGLLGYSGWGVYRFFNPASVAAPKDAAPEGGRAPTNPMAAGTLPKPEQGLSDTWRLVGHFASRGRAVYVLVDGAGRVRYLADPPAAKVSSFGAEVLLPDGTFSTSWSGRARTAGGLK